MHAVDEMDVDGTLDVEGTFDFASTGTFNDDITIVEGKKIIFDSSDTFIQATTDTVENLEIAADQHIRLLPDNNVGINNNNPPQKLTVTGNISASGDIVGLDLSVSEITSSKVLVNAPNPTDDFFLLKSGSLDSLKVNNQGVLVLGGFTFEPTAVRGGLYYDQNDDEFYAGKNN